MSSSLQPARLRYARPSIRTFLTRSDIIITGGYTDGPVYFDRADVVAAIHAPTNVTWKQCGERKYGVFNKNDPPGPENEGDAAPDPIQGVLPQVIEATNRVLVGNGDLDYIIITNGASQQETVSLATLLLIDLMF